MKSKIFIKSLFLIFALLSTGTVFSQSIFDQIKDKAAGKVKEQIKTGGGQNSHWVRLEVRANWTERGKKVYETRAYYSNLVDLSLSQGNDVNLKASVIAYFNEGVVEQLSGRGIEINFYDSDVQVYPHSYAYDSRQDAQADMDKKIDVDKSNERAIYTFIWKPGAKNVGEDTTQPKRVFGIKNPPAKEAEMIAVNTNERDEKAQTAENLKAEAEKARRDKQIWGYAILNVSVKKGSREFARTYVSEITTVSRADYNAFYNTDERFIKPRIWDYFAATVVKAAKMRGEEIIEPYDSSISYKFSLGTTGATHGGEYYEFQPKSVLDEPRQREINYANQSGTPVFYFRWDTSGKNISTDLEKESKRGNLSELPN